MAKSNQKELGQSEDSGERVYDSNLVIDHDLFVLKPAEMIKNVSWNESPEYQKVVHQHFFHTVNSDGEEMDSCSPIGGHFHKMILTKRKGKVPQVECGPPIKVVLKKVRGQMVKTEILAEESDDHTHEVVYLKSNKIKMRTLNPEAIRLQAQESQVTAPIPGIQG